MTQEEIIDAFGEDVLLATGFNEAIIGIDRYSERVIYSVKGIIKILMTRDGMAEEEALEYYDYNMEGGWVGDQTPIWCYDLN